MKKVNAYLIGHYLEALEIPLSHQGIKLEIISGCNALAMCGSGQGEYLQLAKDIDLQRAAVLNIRKNFSEMLSRDPEKYCSNYNLQPLGKEVKYSNDNEYIIIMNTSLGYSCLQDNEILYSDIWPQNEFTKSIKSNQRYKLQRFPFNGAFNWKFFYDKFISAILSEYDSKHIILIRTNAAQWYMDEKKITAFDRSSSLFRNRFEEIDDYFIEKTHCLVIDNHYNCIPESKESGAAIYARPHSLALSQFKRRIKNIIIDGKTDDAIFNNSPYSSPFAKHLYYRLNKTIIEQNTDNFELIQKNNMSLNYIAECYSTGDNIFFNDIIKLGAFLDSDNRFTLSDYVLDTADVEIELIELYTQYMKLNINDIIAVYIMCEACEDKSSYTKIVSNILMNSDCNPLKEVEAFRKRNKEFLQNYKYISSELLSAEGNNTDKVYIPLGNNCYLILDPGADVPIIKYEMDIDQSVDYNEIKGNGFGCPVEIADALCSSYSFYIARAKDLAGETPLKIEFETQSDFLDTLWYIDYQEILNSEMFLIGLKSQIIETNDYHSICNLNFLFKDNLKICEIRSGFTDQLCYYFFSKRLEEATGAEIIYDDTNLYIWDTFNGLEVPKVARDDISQKLLSRLLSKKLLESPALQKANLPELLYQNGCDSLLGIAPTKEVINSEFSGCNSLQIPCWPPDRLNNIFGLGNFDFAPIFYCCLIRPEWLVYFKPFRPIEYISFPEFTDEKNKFISDKMLNSDSVAIHIRRGDFVRWGWEADDSFYVESIEKLIAIDDYPDKKYFVFSDDIRWVKSHSENIGLDLIGDSEVFYIDYNKAEESFRDMQLMTLAKVIIASGSGFVRMASMLSQRLETFFPYDLGLLKSWEEYIGYKNKHDIGEYSQKYGISSAARINKKPNMPK